MRKVYEHMNFAIVGHFASILDEADIPHHIKNQGASVGMGEIPFTEVFPELWVVEDNDYDRAIAVLEPYYRAFNDNPGDWKCPACQTDIEGSFGECWSCGETRPLPE